RVVLEVRLTFAARVASGRRRLGCARWSLGDRYSVAAQLAFGTKRSRHCSQQLLGIETRPTGEDLSHRRRRITAPKAEAAQRRKHLSRQPSRLLALGLLLRGARRQRRFANLGLDVLLAKNLPGARQIVSA